MLNIRFNVTIKNEFNIYHMNILRCEKNLSKQNINCNFKILTYKLVNNRAQINKHRINKNRNYILL